MVSILLLSHGSLSKTFYETASMIMGKIENVSYIELPTGADDESYAKEVASVIEKNDNTLILVDLFGGSPFIKSALVYKKFKESHNVEIVTGMNLGMLIETINANQGLTLKELKLIAKTSGKSGIIDFKEKLEGEKDEY